MRLFRFSNHGHQMTFYRPEDTLPAQPQFTPASSSKHTLLSQHQQSNALDLTEDDDRDLDTGSSKTFHSTSSGSDRVTYQYPIDNAPAPARAEGGLGSSGMLPPSFKETPHDVHSELPPGAAAPMAFGSPRKVSVTGLYERE
jgi:hypothetical protein